MNFETFPKKQEQQNISSIALATLLSLAGFSADQHEVSAAEISPEMSWINGIRELRKDAYTKDNETGAVFIVNKDGTKTRWLKPIEGKGIQTLFSNNFLTQANSQSFKPEKIHIIHTHPLSSIEATGLKVDRPSYSASKSTGYNSTISIPPSMQDALSSQKAEEFFGSTVGYENTIYTIVDPAGTWRIRTATSQDKKEFPEEAEKLADGVRFAKLWQWHKQNDFKDLSEEEKEKLKKQEVQLKKEVGEVVKEAVDHYAKTSAHQEPSEDDLKNLRKAFLRINFGLERHSWKEIESQSVN